MNPWKQVVIPVALSAVLAACTSQAKLEWDQIRPTDNIESYEQYIKKFPDARFAAEARTRLDDLYNKRELSPVFQNAKVGYMDAGGKFAIPARFDAARDFVENAALVKVQEKWGFIDKAGRPLMSAEANQAEDFSEGLAAVETHGKWGFIDKTGKIAIPPQFDDAWPFSEGRALVQVKDKWGFTDHAGTLVIPPTYSGGYIADAVSLVLSANTVTYLDEANRTIAKQPIEWLTPQELPWPSGTQFGYTDKKHPGTYTFGPFDSIVDVFSGGLARLIKGTKWGFIDMNGRMVIEPQYDLCARFREGRALVRGNGRVGFIDSQGHLAVTGDYAGMHRYFSEGLAGVMRKGVWGFVGLNGEVRIAPQFSEAEPFAGGLAAVKVKGKWGFVNPSGELAVPARFDAVGGFKEGLAAVRAGKQWGYIDKTGNYVIPARFDEASTFSNGLASVGLGGKRSYINRTGTVLWTNQ